MAALLRDVGSWNGQAAGKPIPGGSDEHDGDAVGDGVGT